VLIITNRMLCIGLVLSILSVYLLTNFRTIEPSDYIDLSPGYATMNWKVGRAFVEDHKPIVPGTLTIH
jgi:hypothetical protein